MVMAHIHLRSNWDEFDSPEKWRRWLDIAAVEDPDCAEFWADLECCDGCRHLDEPNIWCNLVQMPASRNPILDMIGLACCGFGRDPIGQLTLFE